MDDHAAQVIAELVGNGFFDLEVTPGGVLIYMLSDNAKEISPELFRVMKEAMTDEILEYAKMGLVEIRFDDQANMEWRFTPLGLEYIKSKGYDIGTDGTPL